MGNVTGFIDVKRTERRKAKPRDLAMLVLLFGKPIHHLAH